MHAPVVSHGLKKDGEPITAIHMFAPINDCPFSLLRRHHAGFRSVEAETQNKIRHVFFQHRHLKAAASVCFLLLDSPSRISFHQSLCSPGYTRIRKTSTMAEQAYFSRFPTFAPNSDAALIENFQQLAISKSWGKKSRKFKEERKIYMLALADNHLGSIDRGGAAERLVALQGLCEKLGVSPVPTSITQCKKVCYQCYDWARGGTTNRLVQQLKTVHVCLVDLIDSCRLDIPVHVFGSFRELQRHVKGTKHYFPKSEAKHTGGGILKVLLREING